MCCSRLIHPDAEPEENEPTREARVHALVNELPTESWMCQSSRAKASVSELRQRLRRRFVDLHHDLMRNTASQSAHAVMEMLSQHGRL